jgi:mitogen-activated protein kinase kinase kinase 13
VKLIGNEFITPRERQEAEKMLMKEWRALSKLQHPNIIRMRHACVDPGHLCIVLELAEKGNLYNLLQNQPDLPEWRRMQIMVDVASGMAKLHRHKPKPLVHHDLKPQNILITKNDIAKISDFGTATGTHASTTMGRATTQASSSSSGDGGVGGTIVYMAPEVHDFDVATMNLPSVDVYSFGIVLYEVFTSSHAFEGMRPNQIIRAVCDRKVGGGYSCTAQGASMHS